MIGILRMSRGILQDRCFPGQDRRFLEDHSAERPWGRSGTPRALVTHAMRFPWTKKAKTMFFLHILVVWRTDPKMMSAPNRSKPGNLQHRSISRESLRKSRKSLGYQGNHEISNDFDHPSGTLCKPASHSNVFPRTGEHAF